jgi:hypothetical protein
MALSEVEMEGLLEEIDRHRDNMTLALTADTLSKLLESLAKQEVLHNASVGLQASVQRVIEIQSPVELSENRKRMGDFFLKCNPQLNLETATSLRKRDTGLWLTERHDSFLSWKALLNPKLWLSGIPCSGKTVLCGLIIKEVLQFSCPKRR